MVKGKNKFTFLWNTINGTIKTALHTILSISIPVWDQLTHFTRTDFSGFFKIEETFNVNFCLQLGIHILIA